MSLPYLFRPDALIMLMLRNPAAAHAPKFDDLAAAVRREAESAEADPFDDARMADVVSIADALRAESTELEVLRGCMVRLARQVPRCGVDPRAWDRDTMVTEEAVLKALDKPRKVYSILQATDPGGSTDALQVLLMRMRDEGKVKFDINKGNWRKASSQVVQSA